MATLTTSFQKFSEVSIYSGSYLQVWAKYTSQSVANNQTTVVAELRIHNDPNTGYNCYTHSCNFNGGTFTASDYKGSYYHGWGGGDHVLLSQTLTLTHNQNGTLSFNIGGYFTCSAGIGGTAPTVNITVPKIDRLSLVTLSKSTFNVGETIKANITQYVSSYTQDLYIVIDGNETLVQSGATGEVTIDTSTYAAAIYAATPNAKYLDGTFKLKTYNGTTLVGTDTKNYKANIVNSDPTFNVAYQDTNATTLAITNNNQQIIQNNSTLQINITNASAKNSATLSSVSVNINGNITTESISSATKNINIGTLNLSSDTPATITLTDSRGFSTTQTITLTILEWHVPNAIITLQRKQNFYTATDINVDANYSSLDSKNTIAIQYRTKKTSDNNWGNWNNLTDNVTTTFNADNTYSWDVEVKLTDSLDTYTYTGLGIGVGNPGLYVDIIKHSVGVNCIPQNPNTLEINGTPILDLLHPIGSIYMSVDNTDPGTLFGGTWQKIEDKMILGSGTKYSVGATGGNADGIGDIFGIAGANYGGLSGGQGQGNYNGRVAVVDGSLATSQGSMLYFNSVPSMNFMPPYEVANIWKRVG